MVSLEGSHRQCPVVALFSLVASPKQLFHVFVLSLTCSVVGVLPQVSDFEEAAMDTTSECFCCMGRGKSCHGLLLRIGKCNLFETARE